MLNEVFQAAAQGLPYVAYAIGAYTAYRFTKSALFTTTQNEEALITRFGKHVRTEADPGLHVKWPWPINVVSSRIRTDLLQVDEKLDTKTKDDLFVNLPISIQFEVNDSAKFYFENRNAVDNMKKMVSAAVRTATSDKNFQELYSDRDEVSAHVIQNIKETVKEYGINLRRIIIDEPTAPKEVQAAFNEVRASERLMEASKNKAAAHKIEIVAHAEAEKEADKLRGEGKSEFRTAVFDGYADQLEKLEAKNVPREEALKIMLDTMHQDTLRDIGQQGNMVIVTPGGASADIGNRIAELQTLSRPPASEQSNRPRALPVSSPLVSSP